MRISRKPRPRSAVGVVITLGAALLAGTHPAVAVAPGSPQLSAQDRAVMTVQEPYMELDERVRRIASAQSDAPLAGTRIDVAHRTLDVYWVGAAPADLGSIQKSAAQQGITVKINPAAHSEQALQAAAADLAKVAEQAKAELAVTLHNDGSGLTVRQDGLLGAAQGRRAPTPLQSQILDAVTTVRTRSGIPIKLADQGPQRALPANRDNDGSPHWGGAVTRTSGGACTAGFSMYATGSPSTRFMLTAGHCSNFLDGQTATNGVGTRMGATDFIHELFDVEPRYDIGVIRLDANLSNAGRVYSNQTTSNGHFVKGMASGVPSGGTYCVSGAVSTPNCTLVSTDQTLLCAPWMPFNRCVYYIEWLSNTGNTTYCRGDSGGPIYYWTSAGIVAAGLAGFGYGSSGQNCFASGGISVVASAANRIPGLAVVLG